MAITDIDISETLEAGAPSIKYTGNREPNMQMASASDAQQQEADKLWKLELKKMELDENYIPEIIDPEEMKVASDPSWESEWEDAYQNYKIKQIELGQEFVSKEEFMEQYQNNMATGGRIKKDNGGIMNLGGMEKDYRATGGFVPIGAYEKKDDVPARLSKNEFVMTADAVRAAGGGSINKGAQRMYDTMKHLEASPQSKRMTA